jgi:hypothetical protein
MTNLMSTRSAAANRFWKKSACSAGVPKVTAVPP